MTKLLCLNFGSTSTSFAVFEDGKAIYEEDFHPGSEEYPKFKSLAEHREFALDLLTSKLSGLGLSFEDMDAYVARGGGQEPLSSGVYLINEQLYQDNLRIGNENHPGKLGAQIAYKLSNEFGKPGYVVNPPEVDEFLDEAHYTGFAEIYRESSIHALNQKEVCHRYAESIGKKYEDLNLVVMHIGGGVSITAHRKGKMIDSNNIILGEGPMTPTRSGNLPVIPLIELCYSGKYTMGEMISKVIKTGGLMSHLGTSDNREAVARMRAGDKYASDVVHAMLLGFIKQAGSMVAVLEGQVDQVILTGGMAQNDYAVPYLKEKLAWIAPMTIYPGSFEMEALAAGVMRVFKGEEEAKEYTGVPVWTPPTM